MMLSFVQKIRASAALTSLGQLESKRHLSGSDISKRNQCVERLSTIGEPAVPQLIRKLARADLSSNSSLIPRVIQNIGDPAVPHLARAMHDRNSTIRHNAILLLGRLGTDAAIRELQDESVDLMDKEVVEQALHEARLKHR